MFENSPNPSDESAQMFQKNPSDYSSFFVVRKFRILPFFNYLHDSNSIFLAAGIDSDEVFGRTVTIAARTSFQPLASRAKRRLDELILQSKNAKSTRQTLGRHNKSNCTRQLCDEWGAESRGKADRKFKENWQMLPEATFVHPDIQWRARTDLDRFDCCVVSHVIF